MSNLMEAALSYAAKGYHVFPCKPKSKKPATPNGFKDATRDEGTIRRWWSENPEYNIGLPTGEINGFFALDVDGEKGYESLRRLDFNKDIPRNTPMVRTGNGQHAYFKYTSEVKNSAGKIAGGLDIRGDGGYVLAAGSVHENGQLYESNGHKEPVEAPESLLKALREGYRQRASVDLGRPIPEGRRNAELTSIAGNLTRSGMSAKSARACLHIINNNQCQPPLQADEVDLITMYPNVDDEPQDEVGTLMADVRAEKVEWLWDGRIPLGKLTVLDGDPGLGKSVITMDLAARITNGYPLPSGNIDHLGDVGILGNLDDVGGVVILSAEDGLADTIRPRLDAAHADTTKIVAISTVPDREGNERTISIPEDIATIEKAIQRVDAKLVIVDPLMAFLSGKANYDQDVRKALTPLSRMAQSTGAAVLVVRHLNKQEGGKAIYRGGSSIGIIGAARSGLVVEEHPDDKDLRVLAMNKSNLAEKSASLTYSITTADNEAAKVQWGKATDYDANDILNSGGLASRLGEAKVWLRDKLGDGPMSANALKADARREGISETTLQRAKKGIVRPKKDGPDGQWRWYLEDSQDGQDSQGSQSGQGEVKERYCECEGRGCVICLRQELPFGGA
jgi:RecA-family ATPase